MRVRLLAQHASGDHARSPGRASSRATDHRRAHRTGSITRPREPGRQTSRRPSRVKFGTAGDRRLSGMIRPMRLEDAGAAHALAVETFEAYARSRNEAPEPRPDPVAVRPRYERLARSDPGGAWVAEEGGRLTGCAISILREGVWGLSLFIVHPERQSAGLGRELLRRAHDYADGARGRIILSSRDPRALRAYA